MNTIKKELEDYKILLRNIPSLVVSLFIVSVISMNLLANKELLSVKYLALDCGFTVSWVSFLCMDMICKRFGGKAAAKISFLAMLINLAVFILFNLLSLTPGMWGEYYSTGMTEVNDALNATFGGSWYIVIGSSIAMAASAVVNSVINQAIGKRVDNTNFKGFAIRSYASTFIAQFVDNLVFAILVSHVFFGWTLTQVIVCSITGAVMELLCEIIFSPIGYKVSNQWESEKVGEQYINYTLKKA